MNVLASVFMNEWEDIWVGGCRSECVCIEERGYVGGSVYGRVYVWMYGRICGWKGVWGSARLNGRDDIWVGVCVDELMNGWTG